MIKIGCNRCTTGHGAEGGLESPQFQHAEASLGPPSFKKRVSFDPNSIPDLLHD